MHCFLRTSTIALLFLPALAALAGCTSPGATGFRFTAVADSSTSVASLTDETATDLCLAMIDHYDATLGDQALTRVVCLSTNVTSASAIECDANLEPCIEDLGAIFDPMARCSQSITTVRTGCTATVAEIERCIDDSTELLANVLGGSCADAPIETVAGTRYDTSSPPSCADLPPSCSELVLQSSRP